MRSPGFMGTSEKQAALKRPFVPGWGRLPPYLAGRNAQQVWIGGTLARLGDSEYSGCAVVFYGPRGNGKTSMLTWVENQARLKGIDVIRLASREIPSPGSLIEFLRPAGIVSRLSEISVRGLSFKLRHKAERTIESVLQWRLRKKPLVLAIDEAHVMNAEVGQALLPTVQEAIAAGAPLLLLLAGTPNLPRYLHSLEASFWERAEIMPFDRLSEQASVLAIRNPLRDAGWDIEESVAARLARDCHGYPFFLQLRGDSLWRVLPSPPAVVTVREIEASQPEFDARRERFHTMRFEELEHRGLLHPASAVARKFSTRKSLGGAEILREIEASDRKHPLTSETATVEHVWTELCDLGYVWRSAGGQYEPGIPSLMKYVADEVARIESEGSRSVS